MTAGDLGPQLRERVQAAAAGDPLSVEEMLALIAESGSDDPVVPPTRNPIIGHFAAWS